MKDYSTSIDLEQLRWIKYNSTPEQRMDWLTDAVNFFLAAQESRRKSGVVNGKRS